MKNVLEYLEMSAARVPGRAAYIDERGTLCYADLLREAQRVGSAVARRLPHGGAVAVMMDARDKRCVAALLAALYAGCAYAPLDASMPAERLRVILKQLSPGMILYDQSGETVAMPFGDEYPLLAYEAARGESADDALLSAVRARASEDDALSILFTSGSTGVPKGVVHTMRAYLDWTEATERKYGFSEETVFGNQSPFFYANSIIDIFSPIKLGTTTCIFPASALSFPRRFVELLNEWKITELTMTPSSYVRVASADVLTPGLLPNLQYIILSGEAAPWPTLRQWMRAAPNAGVWNFYGSTEAFSVAVWKLDRAFADGEVVPVGVPFEEVALIFADEDGRALPPGEKGEMYVSDPWLAAGYHRDEPRTAEAFGVIGGKRYYRTGDIGFLNERGELVVLGRRDSQIKHRGYRMELGEVEHALRALPGWKDGCCLFDRDSGRITCVWTGALDKKEIVRGLKALLPKYALPDDYARLDELPRTATGKIDRRALAALCRPRP